MIDYPVWYSRFGIHKQNQLVNPNLKTLDLFQFPKNVVFHYVDTTGIGKGPEAVAPYFSIYNKRLPIDHITSLSSISTGGRRVATQPLELIHSFSEIEHGFKYTPNAITVVQDAQLPITINYALLQHLYSYQKSIFSDYNKWKDIQTTLWKTVARIAIETNKNQFVFITLPVTLPGYTAIHSLEEKMTPSFLTMFNSPEKWEFMEVWKWLEFSKKIPSVLSEVDIHNYSKITCIIFYQTKWFAINLGYLTQWTEGALDAVIGNITKFHPTQIQKLFLKLCLTLQASIISPENLSPVTKAFSQSSAIDQKDSETAEKSNNFISNSNGNKQSVHSFDENNDTILPSDLNIKDAEAADFDYSKVYEEVDADMNAMDHIELMRSRYGKHSSRISPAIKEAAAAIIPTITTDIAPKEDREVIAQQVFQEETIADLLQNDIEAYAELGIADVTSYRMLLKSAKMAEQQPCPYDSKQTISEFRVIPPEALKLSEKKFPGLYNVPDESMHSSTLTEFDVGYIKRIMPKDIVGMVTNIQKAGIILKKYTIEKVSAILGDYEIHTLELKPIDGVSSIVHFKLPIVDSNGEFLVNGKKVHSRKQRGELPIRKINPTTVSLTSYYGKVFVKLSEKKVNNSESWLAAKITQLGLGGLSEVIKAVVLGNYFDNAIKAPRIYTSMSKHFKRIAFNNCTLHFEYKQRNELFGIDRRKELEKDGAVVVGISSHNFPVIVYNDNLFYIIENDGNKVCLGSLANIAGLDETTMPVDFSTLRIYRKEIPLGIVICYFMGIDNVLTLLNIKPRIVGARERPNLKPHEWAIVFSDRKVIFSRHDQLSTLLFAGFNEYASIVSNYFYEAFNQNNVYLNILEKKDITVRYIRELDLMDRLFIDPITLGILKERNEPVTFLGLLFKANELLLSDSHPEQYALSSMRIKGYERFSGAIYQELIKSIRTYKTRNIRGRSKIDLGPFAVWRLITQDPANMLVSDINPLEGLKQSEAVTYLGEGGRTKESLNKKSRTFDISDVGTISEATQDSSNVGINTFTTANPLFNSLRGTTSPFDPEIHGGAHLLSTSAVSSVGADRDDPKRVNFISIQQSHSITCVGNTQPLVRTGYEEVIAHRVSDLFAYIAKEDGLVISVKDTGIVIEYGNGERVGIELGRRYGLSEGSAYAHDNITSLKENDTFKAGDTISYNTGFFEPDVMNPKKIIWKCGMLARTALYEASQTHEDSCVISSSLATKMNTCSISVRSFIVNFKQGIRNLVTVGSRVEPTDPLMIIEDEVTSSRDIFDKRTIETLELLSNNAPKAKKRGRIDRIEVFYHGDKGEMSSTLRKITEISDAALVTRLTSTGKKKLTGEVTSDYRVEGQPLELDTAEIKIYIASDVGAGVGDKAVFGNQLKSTICEVLPDPIRTEAGEEIDAVFGRRSIQARIVLSADIIGTTHVLLGLIGVRASDIYFNNKK